MNPLAPPLTYFGGKTRLAARIAALLPPHRHYVEPFCGSLAVLLAKPPSPMETVNDLDADVVIFWRVLRDQPEALERVCALTPHARAEHQLALDRPGDLPDLERARRVWVALTQGRAASTARSGWRHYVRPTGSTGMPAYLRGYVARIGPAAERLARVSLECRPAAELIGRYGAELEVLLYVDPPYLGASRSTPGDSRRETQRYCCEMLDEPAHAALLNQLRACRAAVVLSGYPSELYDTALAGWDRIEIPTGTGQYARGEWSVRTEVLWSNRPFGAPPGLFAADARVVDSMSVVPADEDPAHDPRIELRIDPL